MKKDLLKKDIEASGLKVIFIAEKMHLTPQGFYKKLNGDSEFTASEIANYCRIRGKTIEELSPIFFD